eukprot:6812294-Pyramimonas_sp.AAC.1
MRNETTAELTPISLSTRNSQGIASDANAAQKSVSNKHACSFAKTCCSRDQASASTALVIISLCSKHFWSEETIFEVCSAKGTDTAPARILMS